MMCSAKERTTLKNIALTSRNLKIISNFAENNVKAVRL